MKYLFLMLLLSLNVLVIAQTNDTQSPANIEGDTVHVPNGTYMNISPDTLSSMLSSNRQFLFINTHIPYDGEIEGTDSFIAFNEIEKYSPMLPKDKSAEIVVYCLSGSMSKTASETLVQLGYSNVINLKGGMIDWQQTGYDLKNNFANSEDADGPVNFEMLSTILDLPRDQFVKLGIDGDAFIGPPNSNLVLVEFGDFNCPHCARFHADTLPQIIQDYGDRVNYVYRNYVSVGSDNMAVGAAVGGECAREQINDTVYLDIISKLYAVDGRKNIKKLIEITTEYDIDQKALLSCVEERRYLNEVNIDLRDGKSVGIRGTPGFVLGYRGDDGLVEGIVFSGSLPYENFANLIDQFLQAQN